MKTSVRKYNEQYRDKMLYIDGYNNAEIQELIRPVKALYSELTKNYLLMKAVNNRYLLKNDN